MEASVPFLKPRIAAGILLRVQTTSVILAGIGGGIAAYKAADVVSRLVRLGHEVHVAMTAAAQQFVTATTFASLTRRRVITEMFPAPHRTDGEGLFPHIFPACRADVFVVMPATADLLAKLAAGIGDDVVVCSALALRPETVRLLAPAMNEHMWRQPVVQRNLRALIESGWLTVGPEEGALACGTTGPGRMAEPAQIVEAIVAAIGARKGLLRGARVMILSGPTREPLDPVRFISNGSSGRMGQALALAAAAEGAAVDFITGPVEPERLPAGPAVTVRRVTTAEEMLQAAREAAPRADLMIFAAAVSDFRPAAPAPHKRPKAERGASLKLETTPDIAAEICRSRRPDQLAVGFALETEDGPARAQAKRAAKQFDAIVLNTVEAIGATTAGYTFIRADAVESWETISKDECARRILEWAAERRKKNASERTERKNT